MWVLFGAFRGGDFWVFLNRVESVTSSSFILDFHVLVLVPVLVCLLCFMKNVVVYFMKYVVVLFDAIRI